jgi:VanZ family protein
MFTIIIENRKNIVSIKHLIYVSLIPLCYGISMEIMQMTLTSTRTGSIIDVVFNSTGIIASMLLWIQLKKKFPGFAK